MKGGKSNNINNKLLEKNAMKNKKRGQGLIEYLFLLLIPVLVISVIPNINKTMKMTLSTVGVDLLETMGEVEVTEGVENPEIIPLHPPVAKFTLPEHCGDTGIYQKGRPIRLANASYDVDGDVDHLQWWVERYDVTGKKIEECTTPDDQPIIVNRTAGTNLNSGFTISGAGYGYATIYGERECMRDPGSFIVKLRVYDNDGFVSKEYSDTFEIRDVRPSIAVTAELSDYARDGNPAIGISKTITQRIVSDACRFYPTDGLKNPDHEDNQVINHGNTGTVTYNGHRYAYVESCPYIDGSHEGIVTFKISNYVSNNATNGVTTSDPDFVAIQGIDKVFEGENAPAKRRYGFTYITQYISSVVSKDHPSSIPTESAEVSTYTTGASVYTKQFKTPGTYLYNATVFDENRVSASSAAEYDDGYEVGPNVGVAVRVLSPEDPDFYDKCIKPNPDKVTCPKPELILSIEKVGGELEDTIYTSVGTFGQDGVSNSTVNASYIAGHLDRFVVGNKSIAADDTLKDKFSSTIADLKNDASKYLGMNILNTSRPVNGTSPAIDFAVLTPAPGERLIFRPIVYYYNGENNLTKNACVPDGSTKSLYWASSDHFLNNYDFNTLSHGSEFTQWQTSGIWGQVYRPYENDASKPFYSASNIAKLNGIKNYWDQQKYPIYNGNVKEEVTNGEILYVMARNRLADDAFSDLNPNPFAKNYKKAGSNTSVSDSTTEPVPADIYRTSSSAIDRNERDVEHENSQLRSNGQLIMIAPKKEMCPKPEQRPIPKLSLLAYEKDIDGNLTPTTVELSSDISISVSAEGDGTFTVGTKTYHVPCEATGCVVQVTSEESVCGTDAAVGCEINGSRWKFDKVITEGVAQVDDDTYYPNTTKITKFSHIYYGKDTGKYYEANPLDEKVLEDSVWKLPINKNINSYAYYGDYNDQKETPDIRVNPRFDWSKEDKTSAIAPNARSAPTVSDIHTSKPNLFKNAGAYKGYFIEAVDPDDVEDPKNLKGYSYELEIIDSQGCATSTKRTITVTKTSDKPIAYCNYIYHYAVDGAASWDTQNMTTEEMQEILGTTESPEYYLNTITFDKMGRYEYYGGKMVQSISTYVDMDTGVNYNDKYILPTVVENGDLSLVEEYNGVSKYKVINNPRTSPLFMFSGLSVITKRPGGINEFSVDYAASSHVYSNAKRGDDSMHFLTRENKMDDWTSTVLTPDEVFVGQYDKSKEYLYSDAKEGSQTYNPRTAQMLTGEYIGDYLNASGSVYGDFEKPLKQTGSTGIVANWEIYPVDVIDATVYVDDLREDFNKDTSTGAFLEQQQQHQNGNTYNVYGALFTEPTTKVCEEKGVLLEDGPSCKLNKPGYYVVKLQLDNTNLPDGHEDKLSNVIECRIKVKVPTLDFKCPWGETVKELKDSSIKFEVETSIDPISGTYVQNVIEPQGDVLSSVKESFTGNERINEIEITPYLFNDPYKFDVTEKDTYGEVLLMFYNPYSRTNPYSNVTISSDTGGQKTIEYKLDELNKYDARGNLIGVVDTSNQAEYIEVLKDAEYLPSDKRPTPYHTLKPQNGKYMIQPLPFTPPGSNWKDGSATKTLPLELWAVKYYITKVQERNPNISTPNTEENASFNYLLETIRANMDTTLYTSEEIDFALSSFNDSSGLNYWESTLLVFLNGLAEYSDYLGLYREYLFNIGEALAFKYDKSFITWTDLQPELLPEYAAQYFNYQDVLYRFYIEKIRQNTTNPIAAIWGTQGSYFRTPFYGKYEAVKRFEQINYFTLLDGLSAYDNNINDFVLDFPEYSDFASYKAYMDSQIVSPVNRTRSTFSYRWWKAETGSKSYYDYKTVSINQGNEIMTVNGNNGSITPYRISDGTNVSLNGKNITNKNSGIEFNKVPYNTLQSNKIKYSGWKTAGALLSEVSYDRGPYSSRMVYLRVNSISNNLYDNITYEQKNGNKVTVPNAYSKICPIVISSTPTGLAGVLCNLNSANMYAPDGLTGKELDGLGYYQKWSDPDNGISSLLPYRISGRKMLKFDGTNNAVPNFNLENSRQMLVGARLEGATTMRYEFEIKDKDDETTTIYGGNKGQKIVNVDISNLNPYAPTEQDFVNIQNKFNAAYVGTMTKSSLSTDTSDWNDNYGVWIINLPSTASDCSSTGADWENTLGYFDEEDKNILRSSGKFNYVHDGSSCHIYYKPDNTVYYDILPYHYTISFYNGTTPLTITSYDGSETTSWKCQMYSAHQKTYSPPPPPGDGKANHVMLGGVEGRIQYTWEANVEHADISTISTTNYKRTGIYPAGTKCFWEITGKGFGYLGTKYPTYDSTPAGTVDRNSVGGPYRFLESKNANEGIRKIQDNCVAQINGKSTYTKVDMRPYNNNNSNIDKTGFIRQRLYVHQPYSNQRCSTNEGPENLDIGSSESGLTGTQSYCRAATMYAVTYDNGCGGTAVLGSGLKGTDVYLAIQNQNGKHSKVLTYMAKKLGGKICTDKL